jgi:hypothetical protein
MLGGGGRFHAPAALLPRKRQGRPTDFTCSCVGPKASVDGRNRAIKILIKSHFMHKIKKIKDVSQTRRQHHVETRFVLIRRLLRLLLL